MNILTGKNFFWHLSRQLKESKESKECKYDFKVHEDFFLFFPLSFPIKELSTKVGME